ncbi:uroporphyrinogen-III synthase [Pseudodonghicola xiamenensis]|uniref:Uroporphyrinogen III methyltransferase n=1 Tax=Pseudodonghicola xiamenensis TaxID=337702 RepID=A0A8J3MC96_9RHOB|nr:uroporphyrinogen-III synthase [Pseudodonghicola xiamenensis]GHG83184.1 uroporphyrinogen III methyltransferase [Pseudodonghicola xiamenensis]
MTILLMTRPRAEAEAFVAGLPGELRSRLTPVYSPLMTIVPLGVDVDTAGIGGVIFTSANGVACAGPGGDLPAYCVGVKTARAAQAVGWQVILTCPDAEHLIAALSDLVPEGPLLHLRGMHSRGDIAGRLSARGIETRALPLYDQRLEPLSEAAKGVLAGTEPLIVPLFSPRTARHFAEIFAGCAPLYLAPISQAAAKNVENMEAAAVEVAKTPDSPGVGVAVEHLAAVACRVEGPDRAQ